MTTNGSTGSGSYIEADKADNLHTAYRGLLNSLPTQSTPATTIYKSGLVIQFTGTIPIRNSPLPPSHFKNITQYRNTLPSNHNHPLQDISYEDHITHIIDSIKKGDCALVSDGILPNHQKNGSYLCAWQWNITSTSNRKMLRGRPSIILLSI